MRREFEPSRCTFTSQGNEEEIRSREEEVERDSEGREGGERRTREGAEFFAGTRGQEESDGVYATPRASNFFFVFRFVLSL